MKEECPANLTFEVVDATALPYENDSFDVGLIANDFQNFTDVQGMCEERILDELFAGKHYF